MNVPLAAAVLAILAAPSAACDPAIGSPLTDRVLEDSFQGVVSIYRGQGSTPGPATLSAWRFYDDNGLQNSVTPLLFKDHGSHLELVGVGTTRASLATGIQQHPFNAIAGTNQLESGSNYVFGFVTRRFEPGPTPGSIVFLGSNSGTIDFDGYDIPTDPWSYAVPETISLNQIYGPGGVAIDPFGFGGRIYSAQFLLNCDDTCPADFAPPFGTLNIFDIQTYIGLYNAQDPAADLAAPFGVFNIFDIQQYINLYNQGCP